MRQSDAEKDWMRQWDHVPTETLIELRDFLFHSRWCMKEDALAEHDKWHSVLCELIKEREKHEGA